MITNMTDFGQYKKIIMAMALILMGCLPCVAKVQPEMFVVWSFNKHEFYCHECVYATVWLYTLDPDISYVNEIESPALNKGSFSRISQVSEISRPRVEKITGVEYTVYPIISYMIAMEVAGKYEIAGGVYQVGIKKPVVYDDPLYGRIRTIETKTENVRMGLTKFEVGNLPPVKEDIPFSGAVGEFRIETFIPAGDIIINDESEVIISVKGHGLIAKDILPEYHDAFGKGNKLKSVSENDNVYFDGREVVSEKELVCEFIPTDINNCEIGIVRFGYFNPKTKKYEVAESKPIHIDVKSSAIKITPQYI